MAEQEQKKTQPDKKANRAILWRTVTLMVIFGVLIFFPLLAKLWDMQIVHHDYYQQLAIDQQTRDLTVSADRGTIYDAKGNILAISASVHSVVLSPKDVVQLQEEYDKAVERAQQGEGKFPEYPRPDNELIAAGLSAILDVDESVILEKLAKTNRQYEVVKTKVEEEISAQVLTFIQENRLSQGVYLEPDTKRYYPRATLASHVVGFVNGENEGAYGLESKYEQLLSGEAGRVVTAKNARGTEMPTRYENYINSVDGADLTLTLNAAIQSMLESALMEGIETYDVQNGGFAIAMDPNTGAILGMASSPEYDLNNPNVIAEASKVEQLEQLKPELTQEEYLGQLGQAQLDQWRNKALNDTYEPGSTFKSIVLAAALEEGVVTERDTFYCSGSVQVADHVIHCHKKEGHGSQTLAQAVENSCNPAFIAIGQRLGAERFYDYLESCGMIGVTGVDIPGEAGNTSLVWERSYFTGDYGISSLATASFGQRFQVTPIQLITGVASVINGGNLLQPYVVERAADKNGNILYQHEPTLVRQVVSAGTSQRVRAILEGVVDGGTGRNAYTAGYRIAGKTGTSETLSEDKHNIVSFVGFAPADDPQVIVLLAYDGPKPVTPGSDYTEDGYYISGGNMAAPMAGKLIANILDYMGVPKQYTPEELSGADTMVPSLVGHYADHARYLLSQNGLSWQLVGEGDVVTGQIPAQGAYIPGNSQVTVYLGEAVPTDQVQVPDIVGLNPEEARRVLTDAGLYLRAMGAAEYYSGLNRAADQSIQAGTSVNRGTVVEVRFVDTGVQDYTGAAIDD